MLAGFLFILFAWFIEMPLWLSILATVIGGCRICGSMLVNVIRLFKHLADDEESKEET